MGSGNIRVQGNQSILRFWFFFFCILLGRICPASNGGSWQENFVDDSHSWENKSLTRLDTDARIERIVWSPSQNLFAALGQMGSSEDSSATGFVAVIDPKSKKAMKKLQEGLGNLATWAWFDIRDENRLYVICRSGRKETEELVGIDLLDGGEKRRIKLDGSGWRVFQVSEAGTLVLWNVVETKFYDPDTFLGIGGAKGPLSDSLGDNFTYLRQASKKLGLTLSAETNSTEVPKTLDVQGQWVGIYNSYVVVDFGKWIGTWFNYRVESGSKRKLGEEFSMSGNGRYGIYANAYGSRKGYCDDCIPMGVQFIETNLLTGRRSRIFKDHQSKIWYYVTGTWLPWALDADGSRMAWAANGNVYLLKKR